MLTATDRIALLLHEGTQRSRGKTGISMLRYSEIPIVAVIDYECAGQSLPELTKIPRNVPIVSSVMEALPYKPTVLAIGIAPSGGALPDAWWQEVKQGVAAGLSVVNGLHTPMANDPELKAQLQLSQWIWDVRREPTGLTVGSGQARLLPCLRILTVGTDMSVGKMSTSLELHKACLQRGLRSRFLATGQTGLMLGHDGVALDAVRVDFASGAIERMALKHGMNHDVLHIEGQGSLMNPASTATLPLLRGSQPTHLVLVHRAGQTHIHNFPHVAIPPLKKAIQVYETIASAGGSFAPIRVAAIALNTFHLSDTEAHQAIDQAHQETGLPCTDVIRYGTESIVEAVLGGR
ncbi:MAG: DUF1611 domain-containing protein [Cyanobacteria bacterium CRU_2_1]|nr:DUF1611 domain-containing protein [Cyanobacteria bacterium RU_5_0]NJR58707.1 DUF1611 domain-containing protein [Cyanobacteria bacterium CRU_2_1]